MGSESGLSKKALSESFLPLFQTSAVARSTTGRETTKPWEAKTRKRKWH